MIGMETLSKPEAIIHAKCAQVALWAHIFDPTSNGRYMRGLGLFGKQVTIYYDHWQELFLPYGIHINEVVYTVLDTTLGICSCQVLTAKKDLERNAEYDRKDSQPDDTEFEAIYCKHFEQGRPLPNARDSNEYVAVVAKKETKAVKESSEDVAMGVGKGESTTRRAAVSPMQMPKQMACQLRCPWRAPRQLVSGGIWRGKCA